MFSIYDGRDRFYQWDIDRKLIVDDKTITQVHFANCLCPEAQVCQAYSLEGSWVVDVPNELLTQYMDIRVWGFDGKMTRYEQVIEVEKRTKPADYIYTPEELKKWEELEKQIEKLKKDVMDCQSLYNRVAELDSLFDEHNQRIISLEERVAALENGGGGSVDDDTVYIDGHPVYWDSLGTYWHESSGYITCDGCGTPQYFYQSPDSYVAIDLCSTCSGGSWLLVNENTNLTVNYYYDEIELGGSYRLEEYYPSWEEEDPYLSLFINDNHLDYGTYFGEPWSDIAISFGVDCPNCGQSNSLEDIDGYIGMCCRNDYDCSQTYYLTDIDGNYVKSDDSAVIGSSYYLTTNKPE